MCKKTLLTFTVLALASLTAFAANKDGIVLSKDGRMVTATKPTKSITETHPMMQALCRSMTILAPHTPRASIGAVKASQSLGQPPYQANPNIGVQALSLPAPITLSPKLK